MDAAEAARTLGVAEGEVIDIKAQAGWWHALHHDMASHEETWRPVALTQDEAAALTTKLLVDGELRIDLGPAQPEPDPVAEGSAESGSGDQVPDGTIAEVLDWVGDDSDRAVAALEAEEARDQPRSTLVAALEKVVG
jgi:hypothetical protein